MKPAKVAALFVLLLLLQLEAMNAKKTPTMPEYKFPLEKLIIPTLTTFSLAVAKETRANIYEYAVTYGVTLLKHLENEVEVQIVNGRLTGI